MLRLFDTVRKAAVATAEQDESFPYEAAYRRLRYYSDTLSEEHGGAGSMSPATASL
ncbi:hypothetical protein ACFSL6_27200 [Paenibacillus thailandensis]|uniref:hypothetical protein n=1 Tax=Paenibacillus thailandensis TaxID=393250 RepID=UPI003639C795